MDEQTPMHIPSLLTFNSPSIQTQASNLYDRHELRSVASHLSQALTPRWSPRVLAGGRRSDLFDSCEVDAVVRQLNGALRATKHGTTIDACFEKGGRKQKKMIEAEGSGRGRAPSLWKRVKVAIFRSER